MLVQAVTARSYPATRFVIGWLSHLQLKFAGTHRDARKMLLQTGTIQVYMLVRIEFARHLRISPHSWVL